jgi:hypothetical protein
MAARRLKTTKAFFLKVLGRLVYRRIVLVERELRDLWMEHSSDLPVTVRRLQRHDVQAYVESREKQTAEEVHRRLNEGSFCYVTWTGDRISSAHWFKTGPAWIPEIDRYLAIGPKQVWGHDSWTARDLRGHNIVENPAAFRPHQKLGMRRVGTMGFVQLGPLRFDFTQMGEGKTQWRLRRSPRQLFRRPLLNPS